MAICQIHKNRLYISSYKVHDELILISGTFWGAIRDEIAAAEPPTGFQGMCTM